MVLRRCRHDEELGMGGMPLPRERAKEPYSQVEIGGFLALADAQPTGPLGRTAVPPGGRRTAGSCAASAAPPATGPESTG
jgi:hypothetical protein